MMNLLNLQGKFHIFINGLLIYRLCLLVMGFFSIVKYSIILKWLHLCIGSMHIERYHLGVNRIFNIQLLYPVGLFLLFLNKHEDLSNSCLSYYKNLNLVDTLIPKYYQLLFFVLILNF